MANANNFFSNKARASAVASGASSSKASVPPKNDRLQPWVEK